MPVGVAWAEGPHVKKDEVLFVGGKDFWSLGSSEREVPPGVTWD